MTIATSDSVDQLPLAAPEEAPAPQQPLRRPQPTEPAWKRQLFLVLALILTAGYWFFLSSFLAPAPGRIGVDENAYLVGGRMLAEHGTTGFKPSDDYQFVGAMFVRTDDGWYYPKYPFGTSLLYAPMVLLGHPEWAFSISPMCAALAVLGMFFLARPIVGSFYALLAMIVLGMGPTTLWLSIIPNSHAPALCFVVWGMFFLLRWMQSERWWIGAIAGLLLGYAVTIRYSEALLLFPLYFLHQVQADEFIGPKLHIVLKLLGLLPIGPIGIAAISRVKWRSWRSYISAAAPVMAWAVPVAALVLFNLFTIGHVTGYDGTNEGQGFALKYFFEKWEFAIEQIHLFGLFIFAPLGVAGLILMFRSHRLTALLLTLWFVPGALLYTAYYWGLNQPGVWYLRFFLTLFPPMIVAAMFLLRNTQRSAGRSIASPLAAGVLTAIAASIGLWGSLHELTRQYRGNLNLHYSAREILTHIKSPAGSRPMILADQGMFPQLLQYMQFMYDADWYANDIFAIRAGGGFGLAGMFEKRKPDDNSPVALQRERIEYIDNLRKGKTDADFVQELHRLMDAALNSNRRVYLVLAPSGRDVFKARYITAGYQMTEIDRWDEPCNTSFDGNELSPSVIPDVILLPWHRQRWGMYEIRHAPATQPSVAVSSR